MRVALVGHTGSILDKKVINDVDRYLDTNICSLDVDTINLIHGRDFLQERLTYDIVVLIYIYNPDEIELYTTILDKYHRVSKLHSLENWRTRLVDTKAKKIFLFGIFDSEITGENIGPLNGYNGPIEKTLSNGKVWIYEIR